MKRSAGESGNQLGGQHELEALVTVSALPVICNSGVIQLHNSCTNICSKTSKSLVSLIGLFFYLSYKQTSHNKNK